MVSAKEYIDKISNLLAIYRVRIEQLNGIAFFDENIFAEQFFKELFNIIWEYELKNVNAECQNEIAIDLRDEKNKIVIQVTSDHSMQKIRKTLKKFSSSKTQDIRVVIFQITHKVSSYQKTSNYEKEVNGKYIFNPMQDIWAIHDVLSAIKGLDINKLEQVYECMSKYCGNKAFIPRLIKKNNEVLEGILIKRKLVRPGDYALLTYGLDILEIIKNNNRIVVSDEAAFGKTIAAKQFVNDINNKQEDIFAFYFRLNVYEGQNIEDFIPQTYESVPMENLVIVFDGFDEIRMEQVKVFIHKLEFFLKNNSEASVIVTSRSNFYYSKNAEYEGTLDTFEEFKLCPLKQQEIEFFVEENGIASKEFWVKVTNPDYRKLVISPFYLNKIVNLIKEEKELPEKKDFMREIINGSFNWDTNKYKNEKIKENKEKTYKILQVIAISLELLERNYISDDEYREIISIEEQRRLVQHCLLWNKDSNGNWSFEHNNFGEYLAAEYLANVPIDCIKNVITYRGTNIIKNSWVNAVSFLVNFVKDKDFINWILDIKPDVIDYLETSNITEQKKFEVFRTIFTKYEEQKIWISDERNISKVFGTDKSIDFLCDKIVDNEHYTIVGNAITMLESLQILYGKEKKIEYILVKVCLNNEYRLHEKYHAIVALGKHNLGNLTVLQNIMKTNSKIENNELRAGYYWYCLQKDLIDQNINLIINTMNATLNKYGNHDEVDLLDEIINLQNCIKNIKTKDALDKVVEFMTKSKNKARSNQLVESVFQSLEFIIRKDSAAIYTLYDFINKYHGYYTNAELKKLLNNLEQYDVRRSIFIKLLNEKNGGVFLFPVIVDEKCLSYFIEHYKDNKYDNLLAERLLFSLSTDIKGYKELQRLYEEKNGKVEERTSYKNIQEQRENDRNEYIRMLFDRKIYIIRFKQFFSYLGKASINKNELIESLNYEWMEQNGFEEIYNTLIRIVGENVNITQNYFDKIDWNYFILSEMYRISKNNEQIIIETDQEIILHKICIDYLEKVDFRSAIKYTSKTSFRITWLAVYLSYFRRLFNWTYPEKVLLDMLEFEDEYDSSVDGIDYIVQTVDGTKLRQRIVNNLSHRQIKGNILKNHINYCIENRIDSCLEKVGYIFLDANNYSTCERRDAEKYLLEFMQIDVFLKKYFYKIEQEQYWEFLDILVSEKKEQVVPFLEGEFEMETDEEEKMKYAYYLIMNNSSKGLNYYYLWMRKNKRTYDTNDIITGISDVVEYIKKEECVDVLLKIIELTYETDFVDKRFGGVGSSARKALINIAHENVDVADEIIDKIKNLIVRRKDLPDIGFCNYLIKDINNSILTASNKPMNIQDVIEEVKKLKKFNPPKEEVDWLK